MKQIIPIKKNHEFRRIYAKGRSAVAPSLVLYCRPNRLGYNRLGITAGSKVGGAVVRNRVRRRLRAIYRLDRENLRPGSDLILVARGRAAGADYQRLTREYLGLTARLGLRRETEG